MGRTFCSTQLTITFLSLMTPSGGVPSEAETEKTLQALPCTAEKYSFPCERNFTELPEINKCLFFSTKALTRLEARLYCRWHEAHLVFIACAETDSAITHSSDFRNDSWVGIKACTESASWQEPNRKEPNYTNWETGPPERFCVVKSRLNG
ncbi:hypothetical protein EGW08_006187, partial [Elysia chlorotica]